MSAFGNRRILFPHVERVVAQAQREADQFIDLTKNEANLKLREKVDQLETHIVEQGQEIQAQTDRGLTLKKYISALESSINSYKTTLDSRQKLLASKDILVEDAVADWKREVRAHEATTRLYEQAQTDVKELQERETVHEAQIAELEKLLGDHQQAEGQKPDTVEQQEQQRLQFGEIATENRILRCTLSTAFRILPGLGSQTSFQQIYAATERAIRLGDRVAAMRAAEGTPSPVKRSKPGRLALSVRKRRRIADEDDYEDGSPAYNDRSEHGSATQEEAGLLSPPPSARKRQPQRANKAKQPGFYAEDL